MSVELVNGYVLFPDPANWKIKPKWLRSWENVVSTGVLGNESRVGLRVQPLVTLSWTVTPWTIARQNQLDNRIRAAKKSGLACGPYLGRASVLQSDCTAVSTVLKSAFWPWAIGDYIFFLDTSAGPSKFVYNVRQITEADGVNLTLGTGVSQTFRAGSLVWPMIFGQFSTKDMQAATSKRGAIALTIAEMVSPATAQLGTVIDDDGEGVGYWVIEDDFISS